MGRIESPLTGGQGSEAVRWGSLLLCFTCLGVAMVPWVEDKALGLCLFVAGMNAQAFIESIGE